MSPRPRRLHRPRHYRHPRRTTPATPAPTPNWVFEVIADAGVKSVGTLFVAGMALTVHEGHGDPPPMQHESPNPTGRVAIEFLVSSTSSITSVSTFPAPSFKDPLLPGPEHVEVETHHPESLRSTEVAALPPGGGAVAPVPFNNYGMTNIVNHWHDEHTRRQWAAVRLSAEMMMNHNNNNNLALHQDAIG